MTRAGRLPLCSCPLVGSRSIQMKSPASGLPDFIANGRPPSGFAVEVLLGDLANQLLQCIVTTLMDCDLYNKGAVFDRHVDNLAFGSPDLLRERAGNAQCEAVPPFLEFGSHRRLQGKCR